MHSHETFYTMGFMHSGSVLASYLLEGVRSDVVPQNFPEIIRVHLQEAFMIQKNVPKPGPHPTQGGGHQQLPESLGLELFIPLLMIHHINTFDGMCFC